MSPGLMSDRHDQPGRGAFIGLRVLQRLVFGLAHIRGMRIEPGQHARDRGLDQLAVANRLDRVLADTLERLAEQVELIVNPAFAALCLRQRGGRRQKHDQSRGH